MNYMYIHCRLLQFFHSILKFTLFLCRSIVHCVAMSDPILPTYKSIVIRI